VLARLPHGEETRLRIVARDVKLRDVLAGMLGPMSLQWHVDRMGVLVAPSPQLQRINRRPTFAEVAILNKLATVKIELGKPVIEQLQQATAEKDLALIWHVGDQQERAKALEMAERSLPATGVAYLDRLCHGRGWTWYLWGTDLMIVSKQMQTNRQLSRQVPVRYSNQPLLNVIEDLAGKADLKLKIDPGALQYINEETRRNFTLLMKTEATVADALEVISGVIGLRFAPDDLAIHVSASEALTATTLPSGPRQRLPFIATMKYVDKAGEEYMIFFRPDDLPPGLVEDIAKKKAERIKQLKVQYGFDTNAETEPAGPGPGEQKP